MIRILLFLFGVTVAGATGVEAMPYHQTQTRLLILVAAGCGLGVDHGIYNGCNPIYRPSYRSYNDPYFGGYNAKYFVGYANGHYSGPHRSMIVNQGGCDGGTLHRVCNVYGVCWANCD